MSREKIYAGFIGAGSIARVHAFALNSLKYYYNDSPDTELVAVTSATDKSRDDFAMRFGFRNSLPLDEFFRDNKIDTVYILGPNKVHFEHLSKALKMSSLRRIYIEKPVCSTPDEETRMAQIARDHPNVKIQTGFQYLFTPPVREALILWKKGILGKPVHFDIRYYHGDYLQKEYRDKRSTRLTAAPDGGAMADLGSHAISMLIAFLGNKLEIINALQSGQFKDVPVDSDLFSLLTLYDPQTGAAGTLSASRISSGTGDLLSMELFAEKGTLRFSSHDPSSFEYFLEETGVWNKMVTGSSYKPVTSFPSGHVPPGWIRPMIHAHYVFVTDVDESFIPDLNHGLEVQRLVRQTAMHLTTFRNKIIQ